jgi:plasmid stabilization system protein ParE
MRLEFSGRALTDLDHIHRTGVRTFGQLAADEYLHQLLDRIEGLLTAPAMAQLRPELGENYRVLVINAHVAIYRIDNQTIRIVRVLNGRQDWQVQV